MTTERRHDALRKLSDPRLHDRLGCKETTMRALIRSGELPALVVRGVLRVVDSDVDTFIREASRAR